jgi:NADH-quinone oxidoreductase subunit M
VILAGVLLKMGTYGFVRLAMPLFPAVVQQVGLFVLLLAVISIIYGALVAMVQPDLKKLVAYSSVSHLGFVMLGLFMLNAQSVQGAILQMINHGLSTGALFLMVGMLYERRHSRMISDFGGLAKQVPVLASLFLLVTLSSIGLPGTNGFVGEVLILIGSYRQAFMGLASGHFFLIILIMIASLGVVLAAVYMLWMFQRVMFGPIRHEENRHLTDLTLREKVVLLPLLVMIFWIGLYPQPFLSKMEASVKQWNSHMEKKRQTQLIQPMPNRWAESRSASFAGLSHDFFTVTDASAGAAVQSEVTR